MAEPRITFKAYDEVLPLTKLKKSKFQRNKHPQDQIIRLAKIMEAHGVRHPIHISKLSGTVCFGHGRWEAAKLNKYSSYPIVYQEFKDEDEEYACVQSDNAIAMWAELDLASINNDLQNLGPDFDIDLLGIKDFVLEPAEKFEAQSDEDAVPEAADTRCKFGDVWQLGRHRLMCGDSTNFEHASLLLEGHKAEMLFTDPPYGVNYTGGIQFNKGGVERNNREGLANDDSAQIYKDVMPVIAASVDGPCYTWFAFTQCRPTVEAIEAIGEMHALIIWHKTNATYAAMNAQYKQRHEPCIYWKPKGSTLRWDGPTNECTIWDIARDGRNEFHPTQKPVALAERAIGNHKAKTVLDLFGGSGSTLIAAEKVGRIAYIMELSPSYCDVILTRWEKYTGQKAERLDAKEESGAAKAPDKSRTGKKPGRNSMHNVGNGKRSKVQRRHAGT